VLDARQEGDSYRRVEVITRERRRRRWTGEEKARIVAESFEEGANISEVARRNGVARGQLTVWRGQVTAMAGKAPSFVPIQIGVENGDGAASAQARSLKITAPPTSACGVVEIEVSGAVIRVGPGVDAATLYTVLSVLRGDR
jgi:transposase